MKTVNKTINVNLDLEADNLASAFGINEDRQKEIADTLGTPAPDGNETAKIQAILEKYSDNELVFALVALQSQKMNAAFEAVTEGAGDDDDDDDNTDDSGGDE